MVQSMIANNIITRKILLVVSYNTCIHHKCAYGGGNQGCAASGSETMSPEFNKGELEGDTNGGSRG